MKRTLALLLFSGVILSVGAITASAEGISAGTPGSGYEATENHPANADSTAEFTIEPGKLTLDKVSDLHFSKAGSNPKVADFVTDQDLTLDNQAVSSKTGKDGNSDKQVTVSDFRGSHDGWTLAVKMTPFLNAHQDGIKGSEMTLTALDDNTKGNSVDASQLSKPVTINADDTNFIVADPDKGTFTNTFNLDGKLHIPAADNKSIQAGTYQSTVTWTLSTTPKVTPAN